MTRGRCALGRVASGRSCLGTGTDRRWRRALETRKQAGERGSMRRPSGRYVHVPIPVRPRPDSTADGDHGAGRPAAHRSVGRSREGRRRIRQRRGVLGPGGRCGDQEARRRCLDRGGTIDPRLPGRGASHLGGRDDDPDRCRRSVPAGVPARSGGRAEAVPHPPRQASRLCPPEIPECHARRGDSRRGQGRPPLLRDDHAREGRGVHGADRHARGQAGRRRAAISSRTGPG